MSNIINAMPKMLTGTELISAMTMLPEYDEHIREENEAVRLIALSNLYRIYLPSQMSSEIYSKVYLALLRSLQKKGTKFAVQQRNQNTRAIRQQEYTSILGGSDSFTIIGTSGIGKSSAISRAINLIASNGIIEVDEPYTRIIPCVIVQCPFDSSVKGLLLDILRKVDECLESRYYESAVRARATTDMLIGSVSQVALNHIGMLIVDEIQNVVNNKHGKSLIAMLTQLINNSGISICMVGTPECTTFFEQAMQLARRSLGLQYDKPEYGKWFYDFCNTIFNYQYVRNPAKVTPAICDWLYEHSSGIISNVVTLVHDAQEIAILNGTEKLDLIVLNEAYQKRMSLLHGYIEPSIKKKNQTTKPKKKSLEIPPVIEEEKPIQEFTITDLATKAKKESLDIVKLLKSYMPVVEVNV